MIRRLLTSVAKSASLSADHWPPLSVAGADRDAAGDIDRRAGVLAAAGLMPPPISADRSRRRVYQMAPAGAEIVRPKPLGTWPPCWLNVGATMFGYKTGAAKLVEKNVVARSEEVVDDVGNFRLPVGLGEWRD